MNIAQAIAFLRENQPFPNTLTPEMDAQIREMNRVLCDHPDEAALPWLVNCFAFWDDPTLMEGFQTLFRRFDAKAAVPQVMKGLKSEHWAVRMGNAEMACIFPDPRLIGLLSTLLKDEEANMRFIAAIALETIGGTRVRQIAREQLKVEGDEDVVEVWREVLLKPTRYTPR